MSPDILPVTTVIEEGERSLVDHLQKAGGGAAILNIAIRSRHIEAVTLSNESRLGLREAIELAMSLNSAQR
jgi:hypothetical protein